MKPYCYGGVCSACRFRRIRGNQPRYRGPCLNGCGRLGRGGSGFCGQCFRAIWRRSRMVKELTGTDLALDAIGEVLEHLKVEPPMQREAVRVARRLVRAIETGELLVRRNPDWRALAATAPPVSE